MTENTNNPGAELETKLNELGTEIERLTENNLKSIVGGERKEDEPTCDCPPTMGSSRSENGAF